MNAYPTLLFWCLFLGLRGALSGADEQPSADPFLFPEGSVYFRTPTQSSFLHEAACIPEDLWLLEGLIKGGLEDVNSLDPYGKPPLVLALEHNNLSGMKSLLHLGADPNRPTGRWQRRPLHLAVLRQNLDALLLLLAHQADPSLGDDKGNTPLAFLIALSQTQGNAFMAQLLHHASIWPEEGLKKFFSLLGPSGWVLLEKTIDHQLPKGGQKTELILNFIKKILDSLDPKPLEQREPPRVLLPLQAFIRTLCNRIPQLKNPTQKAFAQAVLASLLEHFTTLQL